MTPRSIAAFRPVLWSSYCLSPFFTIPWKSASCNSFWGILRSSEEEAHGWGEMDQPPRAGATCPQSWTKILAPSSNCMSYLVISVQESEAQGVRCCPSYEGCGYSVDGVSAVANNRECPAPLHRLHLLWLSYISERTWCCLRLPPLSTRPVASSWLKSPQLEYRFLPLCVPYTMLPSSRENVRANTCCFDWG